MKYENNIEAIVCVAYTNEVPTTVKELDYMSQVACQDNQTGTIAVAYTVWSRKRGAGREIINKLLEFVKEKPFIKRLIKLGFRKQRPFLRMAKGQAKFFGETDKMFALAGPELG